MTTPDVISRTSDIEKARVSLMLSAPVRHVDRFRRRRRDLADDELPLR